MSEQLLVRLKPYDKKRQQVLRSYSYQGIKFTAERGWYLVDADVAEYLRNVVQQDTVPNSPYAFDVCTRDEAEALDARNAEALARATLPATAASPVRTTTVTDARRPRKRGESSGTLTTSDLAERPDVSTRSPSFDTEPGTFPGDADDEAAEETTDDASVDEAQAEDPAAEAEVSEGESDAPPPAEPPAAPPKRKR